MIAHSELGQAPKTRRAQGTRPANHSISIAILAEPDGDNAPDGQPLQGPDHWRLVSVSRHI